MAVSGFSLSDLDAEDCAIVEVARDEEVDPVQCRALWVKVLLGQWEDAFKGRLKDVSNAKDAARRWFGSRDCATVCVLAGVDPEAVLEAFERRLAEAGPESEEAIDRARRVAAARKRGDFAHAVTIRGQDYPTISEAARILGVNATGIRQAIKRGTLDNVGLSKDIEPQSIRLIGPAKKHHTQAVVIEGVTFNSHREASIQLGFEDPQFVAQALRKGSPVGLRRIVEAARVYRQSVGCGVAS